MDNPVFKNNPYTRRDAWAWLIEHAEWTDGKKIDAQGVQITLKRGQLSHSIRHLAKEWTLSVTTVARIINAFEKAGMIEKIKTGTGTGTGTGTDTGTDTGTVSGTVSGTPQTVISICNYSQYQDGLELRGTVNGTDTGTVSGTASETQSGTESGTIYKETKELKEDKEKKVAREDAPAKVDYRFEGKVIKLSKDDYDKWKQMFTGIPDFDLELWYADTYYAQHPPKGGNWFFQVARWMKKEHQKHVLPETEEEARLRKMYERAGF